MKPKGVADACLEQDAFPGQQRAFQMTLRLNVMTHTLHSEHYAYPVIIVWQRTSPCHFEEHSSR